MRVYTQRAGAWHWDLETEWVLVVGWGLRRENWMGAAPGLSGKKGRGQKITWSGNRKGSIDKRRRTENLGTGARPWADLHSRKRTAR